MKDTQFTNYTLATALALGLSMASPPSHAAKPDWQGHEKCMGLVKKGMNDCGTSQHNCAGQAAVDNDPEEWIYLPSGTCKKLAGASIKPAKK